MAKRRVSILALILALTLPLACGSPTVPASTPTLPPAVSPTPAPTEAAGRIVTLDDDGRSIEISVGGRFRLSLGEFYDWTVALDDPGIVSRVPSAPTVRGSQGLFEAQKAGRTTVRASGDPTCRKDKPPCGAPSRLFQVELVVR